jgi:thymidylate kinase
MHKQIFIEIAGEQGAGKTQVLRVLTDLFANLGADVVWTDGGGRKRGGRVVAKRGPFEDTQIIIDTVLIV